MAGGMGLKRLLSGTALPYLENYKELTNIAHKGHKAIFESLFDDLCKCDTDMSVSEESGLGSVRISVVLKATQLIAAAYLKTFLEKTDHFYGRDGVVRKMLADDPSCFDGVPISALAAEGQVSLVVNWNIAHSKR